MRLIDTDALIGPLKLQMESYDRIGAHERAMAYSECIREIGEAPTVDAEPVRHGRWVKMTGMLPTQYHGHYECSECQWHMKGLRNSWTQEEELTYCPGCGAKMDGEGEV